MSDLDYMEEFQEDSTTAMSEVMRLVDALIIAQERVVEAEELLKERSAFERKLREETIPQYMGQHRLSSLELENGRVVSVSDELSASLPKDEEKRRAAIAFLMANEGGELVKDEITIVDPDEELVEVLQAKELTYERALNVPAAQLKAWLRRVLGYAKNTVARMSPQDIPPELSLYLYKNTKISKGAK